ncbi:alpha/beta hydrolase [Accumulibacter sp.]|uniref:RBBP9/YdeN family alpha/beta hydrolase n=1 Tax=Accumulibacter sp. TaxID=2053492 RepID=UPI0025F66C3C|nr:alpha/beta hydrolase [Accumulibacter sp.]MCM8624372.1 alpha/beta hydrolase [Accumulibacter sp.]
MTGRILIVPGLHDSGPGHWQSWLESVLPETHKVRQSDWERPHLPTWAGALLRDIDRQSGPVWILAHSFGCLATVAAGLSDGERILGALLVAPADPARFGSAASLIDGRLSFPSLLIASTSDPWLSADAAQRWARVWGSQYRTIGAAGHINVASGFGPWPEVLDHFASLQKIGQRACRIRIA